MDTSSPVNLVNLGLAGDGVNYRLACKVLSSQCGRGVIGDTGIKGEQYTDISNNISGKLICSIIRVEDIH